MDADGNFSSAGGPIVVLKAMGIFVSGLLQRCRVSSPQDPEWLWVKAVCFEHTHVRHMGKLRFLALDWLCFVPKASLPELVLYPD